MAKKNSLKVAPYAPHKIRTWVYDESIRPEGKHDWDSRDWNEYYETKTEKILFDGYTLMEYTSGAPGDQTTMGRNAVIDWRPNDPFTATLTIRELDRGRSAARFWFEDEVNQIRYPFFGQTLVDMLTNSVMDHGKVTGTWIVVKKGSNYGIELYQP